jgi:hypothetical protein
MIVIELAGKEYQVKNDWREISIADAREIVKNDLPANLKEFFDNLAKGKEDAHIIQETDEDIIRNIPVYQGKIIKLMSNIPDDIIGRLYSDVRQQLYSELCLDFDFGIRHTPFNYEMKGIDHFTHKGKEFYFIADREEIDQVVKGGSQSIVEFAEVADLQLYAKELKNGSVDVATNVISILCREKKNGKIEKYNRQKCLDNAKEFDSLPVSIMFEVTFFLNRLSNIFIQDSRTSLSRVVSKQKKQVMNQD